MKGFLSEHIVSKEHLLQNRKNIRFAGPCVHFPARKSYRLVAVKGLRIIRDGKPRTATLTFTQLLSSGSQRSGQCGSAYSLAQIPQVAPRHEVTTTRRGREGEGGVPVGGWGGAGEVGLRHCSTRQRAAAALFTCLAQVSLTCE